MNIRHRHTRSQAGKGDAPRPVNLEIYRRNFDAINWRKSKKSQSVPSAAAP
jgi:hypothetical protein